MTDKTSSLLEIDPKKLLSAKRLDIVVKTLYFSELLKGRQPSPFIESLYKKHILLRTAGVEPPDFFGAHVKKDRIDEYLETSSLLLKSISERGFEKSFAIPFYSDGTLGNGAHRLAASLALNQSLWVNILQGAGPVWDYGWFQTHQFLPDEMGLILKSYLDLSATSTLFILWNPSISFWNEIAEFFAAEVDVVGWIDIDFNHSQPGFVHLIHEIYQTHLMKDGHENIDRKIDILKEASKVFRIMILDEKMPDKMNSRPADSYRKYRRLKDECRQRFHDRLPEQVYLTLHGVDGVDEKEYVSTLLLSANNLSQYKSIAKYDVRPEMCVWIDELRKTCMQERLDLKNICIVGSSPLEIVGIRNSTDIDITLSVDGRQRFGPGISHISPNVDIVTEGYHRSNRRDAISDQDLICNPENHFYRFGLKFANIEIVEERKEFSARDKDLKDIELIKKWRNTPKDQSQEKHGSLEILIRNEVYIRRLEAELLSTKEKIGEQAEKFGRVVNIAEAVKGLLREFENSNNIPAQLLEGAGKLCWSMGMNSSSIYFFNRALEKDKGNPRILEFLERIHSEQGQ